MLITDQFEWDLWKFDAHVEGLSHQVEAFPHERVAFWADTSVESILTLFAIWKVGKVACPLNIRLPKAPLDLLETALFTPTFPSPETPTPTKWNLSRLGALLFTSGSSGSPKIAKLTLGNLVFSAQGANQLLPLQPNDVWAATLPLFHVGGIGILLRSYLARSSICLDPKKATRLSLVPTQLFRILKEVDHYPRLKSILLGGAPLPSIASPWRIIPTYGMTEMSSQIVTQNRIHPYAEMKIGHDQEVLVRGKVLFQGYLNSPPPSDWFPTGDLGKWEGGVFQILGRKDNMFISGGENIQPEEIEQIVRTTCHLPDVVVVPISDPDYGHRPVIFLNDPSKLRHIQETLKHHLPKYKIPIQAFELPPQESFKVNRQALAQIAAEKPS